MVEGEILDSAAIHALLGHRYPFLLVDRIVIVDPGRRVGGTKRMNGRLVASADLTTVIRAAKHLPDEHD